MKVLTHQDARLLSPLLLAYAGDSFYELITREHIIEQGNMPVGRLHRKAVSIVCASAQSKGYEAVAALLTEEETAIFKRGRNANGNHIPRHADPLEYRRATGVEALFGFLYLTGQGERARELYERIYQMISETSEGQVSDKSSESPCTD